MTRPVDLEKFETESFRGLLDSFLSFPLHELFLYTSENNEVESVAGGGEYNFVGKVSKV